MPLYRLVFTKTTQLYWYLQKKRKVDPCKYQNKLGGFGKLL